MTEGGHEAVRADDQVVAAAELVFQKHEVVGIKSYCYMKGMYLWSIENTEGMPQTSEEWSRTMDEVDEKALTAAGEAVKQFQKQRAKKKKV